MRSIFPFSPAIAVVLILAGCGGGGTSAASAGDGGSGSESGTAIDASVPDSTSCPGDKMACLFGTVQVDQFVVVPSGFRASLYRVFPSGAAKPLRSQLVAKDGTWAFGGLPTWNHYYVVVEPGFLASSHPSRTVATRVGPLSVPNTSLVSTGVHVKPVQLDVLQGSVIAGPQEVQGASARLFDVQSGDEMGSGAAVFITIGSTSTPMPWTPSASAYEVTFTPPLPAGDGYAIVTSPNAATPPTSWRLAADPPQSAGAISSPPSGATIPAGMGLTVTWSGVLSGADYEIVDLFQKTNGSWSQVYTSPEPAAADSVSETIPASSVAHPGEYLLNVAFAKANCPPTADGCVEASTVANELLTVQ